MKSANQSENRKPAIPFPVIGEQKNFKLLKKKVRRLENYKRTAAKIEMIAEVLNTIVQDQGKWLGQYNKSELKKGLECVQISLTRRVNVQI